MPKLEFTPPELVRFKQHGDKPVFTAAGQGTWEVKIRERGWIHLDPAADGTDATKPKYRLWYTGYDGTREGVKRLGYATSADGIAWTRHKENPIVDQLWVEREKARQQRVGRAHDAKRPLPRQTAFRRLPRQASAP